MKILSTLILSLSMALLLAGCGGSSGPSATAEDFFDALSKRNIEKASEKVLPHQREIISMFSMASDEDLAGMSKVKFVREEIDGDRAVVYMIHPDEEGEESINLVRVDNEWLIDIGDLK